MTGPAVLALWSAPRSRSTAFQRMMDARGDRIVLHEPFSRRADFGAVEVAGQTVTDEPALIAAITALGARTPVFFKDTTDFAYPGLLADQDFLASARHTFLLRHPAEAIASHARLTADLGRDEIGFARLAEIRDAVAAATGRAPVVVDSDDLLERPEEVVRAYCAAVGIPFRPAALHWRPGLRDGEEGTSRWHESTSRTSGFVRGRGDIGAAEATVRADPVLAAHLDFHLPHYERLRRERLRV
ncbi:MAG TPA: hypothetical protein VLM05_15850 [Mycobacteriales bacterium]|nr:hypothetical protein [Mycobacteriales bacterium]